MKILGTLFVLLFAVNIANAGQCLATTRPEYGFIPEKICVERIVLAADGQTADVESSVYSGKMQVHADRDYQHHLVLSAVLEDERGGSCEERMYQELRFSIWMSAPNDLEPDGAAFSYEYTPDTCHSPVQKKTYLYN